MPIVPVQRYLSPQYGDNFYAVKLSRLFPGTLSKKFIFQKKKHVFNLIS